MNDVLQVVSQHAIIPVIAIERVEDAIPLADALKAGGLPLIEITFRTAAAAKVIERLRQERPEMLIGAGTVLSVENLAAARNAGARFGVAPGLNSQVVAEAYRHDFPFIPGILTPSEIEQALALGCKLLKFFPADAAGGTKMLEALSAPYGHTGVRFVPTGGVNMNNLGQYLQMKTVAAVGGTWLAKKEDISASRWDDIRRRAAEAVALVAKFRSQQND